MGHTPKLGIYYPDSTEPRQIPGDFEEMYPTVDPLVAHEGMNGMLPLPGGGYGSPTPYPGMIIEYANTNVDPMYSWNWKMVYDPESTGGNNNWPWRYIGGAPIEIDAEVGTNIFIANSAHPASASGWMLDPVLQFPIPWEGDWDIEAQITCVNPSNSSAYMNAAFASSASHAYGPPDRVPLKFRGDVSYQTNSFRGRYNLDDGLHGIWYYTSGQTGAGAGSDFHVQHRTLRIWPVSIGDHNFLAT